MFREEPHNRLAKMGALATPFRAPDKHETPDSPPPAVEREEPRSETPPGEHTTSLQKKVETARGGKIL